MMLSAEKSLADNDSKVLLRNSSLVSRTLPVNLNKEDAELFQDAQTYSTNDVYLKPLGAVRVSPDSVVYKRGRLLPETVVEREQIPYYRLKHFAKKLLTARHVSLGKGIKYLLATDAWSGGHYHWFTEVLPRLILIEEWANEFVLLLPDTPYIRAIAGESLELLGIKFAGIVWMGEDQFFSVPEMYHVTRIAAAGQLNDEIMKELNQRFSAGRRVGAKRFYISRSEAKVRNVLNEAELESILFQYGFETVRPENHSLCEQIEMFAECGTVIGIHGAGLTNCVFMPPGGSLVELGKREPNYGYWHLADAIGLKYFYYYGVPDSELSLIGRGANLNIPAEDFEEKILKKL